MRTLTKLGLRPMQVDKITSFIIIEKGVKDIKIEGI